MMRDFAALPFLDEMDLPTGFTLRVSAGPSGVAFVEIPSEHEVHELAAHTVQTYGPYDSIVGFRVGSAEPGTVIELTGDRFEVASSP